MIDEYHITARGKSFVLLIKAGLSVEGVLSAVGDARYEYVHTFAFVGTCDISEVARIALHTQGFYLQQHVLLDRPNVGKNARRRLDRDR